MLFLQGGASAQFSLIPQNILNGKTKACYIKTGAWSEKAIKDAQAYCDVAGQRQFGRYKIHHDSRILPVGRIDQAGGLSALHLK